VDTSEQYIKMCEKVEEIQEEWKKEYSDFVIVKCVNSDKNVLMLFLQTFEHNIMIWLPRQDQLQEMIIGTFTNELHNDAWGAMRLCVEFGRRNDLYYSLEQLWLAFVMKEKFNKTWNGEDWIGG